MKTDNGLVVCAVTFPIAMAGFVPLANLVNIFRNFSRKIYVVTSSGFRKVYPCSGNRVVVFGIPYLQSDMLLTKMINFLRAQIEIITKMSAIHSHVDFYVFFIGGETLLLPILFAKIFKKKVVLYHAGSIIRSAEHQDIPFVNVLKVVRYFVRLFADRITVYSSMIVKDDDLEKFRFKIAVAHEHSLDCNTFNPTRMSDNQNVSVGYIGRLTSEKGVLSFIEAMPLVSKEMGLVNFMIIGEGPLLLSVQKIIHERNVDDKVKLLGWVPHQQLPKYLKKFGLLVLPSVTEGLPNVVLEAMACGVPVLATPVGAIPDIIENNRTGFLLESNDPKHIADKIVELLNKPKLLEEVSRNAYKWVKENFSKEKTIKTWQKILKQLR